MNDYEFRKMRLKFLDEGQMKSVDLLKEDEGSKITFDNVLLFVDGENVEVGQPYLSNVTVTAEILETVKDKKLSTIQRFI